MVDEGLVKERMAIPDGGVEGWITCDPQVAKESVDAGETKAGRDPMKLTKDFVNLWAMRKESHRLNIQALKDAKTRIPGGYSA